MSGGKFDISKLVLDESGKVELGDDELIQLEADHLDFVHGGSGTNTDRCSSQQNTNCTNTSQACQGSTNVTCANQYSNCSGYNLYACPGY